MSAGHKPFFTPRLDHHKPDYNLIQTTAGSPVADWRSPNPTPTQSLSRSLFCKRRQNPHSLPGLSKLPNELLSLIFNALCGREINATRLVYTEWEVVGRPCFAKHYLGRTLFWLTGSHLRLLHHLARKFGPYMQHIYIATDHFTVKGALHVAKAHLLRRLSAVINRRARWRRRFDSLGVLKADRVTLQSLGACNHRDGSCVPHVDHPDRWWRFFAHYLSSVCSQAWMPLTRGDVRRLSEIMAMLTTTSCESGGDDVQWMPTLTAVHLHYDRLSDFRVHNVQKHGRVAPEFGYEMLLFSSSPGVACDVAAVYQDEMYANHVERVVMRANASRCHRLARRESGKAVQADGGHMLAYSRSSS